jgi:hypothetical protein
MWAGRVTALASEAQNYRRVDVGLPRISVDPGCAAKLMVGENVGICQFGEFDFTKMSSDVNFAQARKASYREF